MQPPEQAPYASTEPNAILSGAQGLRCFVFTCRDSRTDFRRPLAEALRDEHETWYVWLRRHPLIWRPGSRLEAGESGEKISLISLLRLLRTVTKTDALNLYFNSTNTSFPFVMVLLRLVCGRGIWCLDMHDDLLYDYSGFRRLRAAIGVKLQVWTSDVIVRGATSLAELFPTSLPFGNASQVRRTERLQPNYKSVLVLASLDQRFDFDLMDAAARDCRTTDFDIYGQISRGELKIQTALDRLCDRNPNVKYHGPYNLANLEQILLRYAVSFAPYRMHSRLTRYLDPLRLYHCLNSGMELISTPIPQTEHMANAIHLVRAGTEVSDALSRLAADSTARRNSSANYQLQTWQQRADRLVEIAGDLPKGSRLRRAIGRGPARVA